MRHAFVVALVAPLLALAACSDDDGAKARASASASTCTAVDATQTRQVLITANGFSPSCAKIQAGKQFFFVNHEAKKHTATTEQGSPATFDARFSKKNETYATVLKAKGAYTIKDSSTGKTMTLIVT